MQWTRTCGLMTSSLSFLPKASVSATLHAVVQQLRTNRVYHAAVSLVFSSILLTTYNCTAILHTSYYIQLYCYPPYFLLHTTVLLSSILLTTYNCTAIVHSGTLSMFVLVLLQMKQEIGIGPRNPNYVNPFSNSEKQRNKAQVVYAQLLTH